MSSLKTIKPYTTKFKHYGDITVPAGVALTHHTAMGFDSLYHFVNDFN